MKGRSCSHSIHSIDPLPRRDQCQLFFSSQSCWSEIHFQSGKFHYRTSHRIGRGQPESARGHPWRKQQRVVNNLRLPSSESIALYTFERDFIATLHYIFPSLPKNRKITEWSESEEEETGQEKLKGWAIELDKYNFLQRWQLYLIKEHENHHFIVLNVEMAIKVFATSRAWLWEKLKKKRKKAATLNRQRRSEEHEKLFPKSVKFSSKSSRPFGWTIIILQEKKNFTTDPLFGKETGNTVIWVLNKSGFM